MNTPHDRTPASSAAQAVDGAGMKSAAQDRGPRVRTSSEAGSVPDTKEGTREGHGGCAAPAHSYRWTLRERIVWRTSDWLYGCWLYLTGRV